MMIVLALLVLGFLPVGLPLEGSQWLIAQEIEQDKGSPWIRGHERPQRNTSIARLAVRIRGPPLQ
jgi:hypothetical protein